MPTSTSNLGVQVVTVPLIVPTEAYLLDCVPLYQVAITLLLVESRTAEIPLFVSVDPCMNTSDPQLGSLEPELLIVPTLAISFQVSLFVA